MINDASVAIAVAIGSATADLSLITNNGDGTSSHDRADFHFLN
ncbi:hypothetical protein [Marimonas lutisalis]|nr:hypothetical protein [Marimonas lutisalis]